MVQRCPDPPTLEMEAEDASLFGKFTIGNDAAASGHEDRAEPEYAQEGLVLAAHAPGSVAERLTERHEQIAVETGVDRRGCGAFSLIAPYPQYQRCDLCERPLGGTVADVECR